ncbi:hypothetical protein NX059_000139 [Plenodomus lindquistii]|nr:hypothetical protein NX059_000139 [Plenodomus lindquistii]
MEEPGSEAPTDGVYDTAKPSKFHFKSSTSKRRSKHHSSADEQEERHSKRHRSEKYDSSRRSHRDSRRKHKSTHHSDRHPTSTLNGAYYDPNYRHRESLYDDAHAHDSSPDPTTAFRESLFDALADDEGAAYWEGVYGQPVHIYPDTKPGPNGTLERMTEDEYAEYVRTKMWEKSHEYIVQEREARERERKKRKDARRGMDEHVEREDREREDIRRRMEDSLRRGEERKRAKEVEAAWGVYLRKWEALKTTTPHLLSEDHEHVQIRDLLPWPVLSGKAKHVTKDEIERFLKGTQEWKADANKVLKAERVRWHPDKLQQRFGQHVDAETMKLVTAVFQVVDRLWNERK